MVKIGGASLIGSVMAGETTERWRGVSTRGLL